jgi:hypothetical protein
MTILGRDGIGRVVALAVGVAIGLRALQVANVYFEKGSYYAISGGGTVIGLVVAVGFVGALALWRRNRSPDGTGGPRLVALAAGMILGGFVGWIMFGAS